MNLIEQIKDVARLASEINRIDLHRKVIDLMTEVTQLAEANLQLTLKNAELRREVEALKIARAKPSDDHCGFSIGRVRPG